MLTVIVAHNRKDFEHFCREMEAEGEFDPAYRKEVIYVGTNSKRVQQTLQGMGITITKDDVIWTDYARAGEFVSEVEQALNAASHIWAPSWSAIMANQITTKSIATRQITTITGVI